MSGSRTRRLICAVLLALGPLGLGATDASAANASVANASAISSAARSGPPLLGGPHVTGAGGKFAGFTDTTSVSAIGADWRVPAVAANSRAGSASTWIGVDAYGRAVPAPFLQLGTTEDAVSPLPDTTPQVYYEAFWSDPAHDDEPIDLFGVRAGDRISSVMTLAGRGWRLSIHDLASGRSRTFSVNQEGAQPFTRALWLQEDVTDAYTDAALPYPNLTAATITSLSLNHRAPSYAAMISSWMGLPGGYLAPTAVRGDAFSVLPRRLTGAGAAYLRIVASEDAAADAYIVDLDAWTSATPLARIEAETAKFVPVLSRTDARLAARRWPGVAAREIKLLVENGNYQASHLEAAATQGSAAVTAVIDQANQLYPADHSLIRRELGVQESAS